MMYRVILDCIAPVGVTPIGFYSVKFVEAESEDDAIDLAIHKTKTLMIERGFSQYNVEKYRYIKDSIDKIDENWEIYLESQRSFIFYNEE